MTVGAWFSRNLDHGGTGGGTQDARGARVRVKELNQAGTPLKRMVGKGPAHPPARTHCHQQETQVKLPSFFS